MNDQDSPSRHGWQRWLPTPDQVREHRLLRWLSRWLGQPALWHLDHRSAPPAFFWGLLCACLPMPMQMLPATLGAIASQAHLPLTLALVWLNNPLTILPIFYAGCRLGDALLGVPPLSRAHLEQLWTAFTGAGDAGHEMAALLAQQWRPLLLGCVVLGLLAGGLGYAVARLCWPKAQTSTPRSMRS